MMNAIIGSRASFNANPSRASQSLTLTVYDDANAILCGTAWTNKGESWSVEYTGTALECEIYINALIEGEHQFSAVKHKAVKDSIVLDALSKGCTLNQGFALGAVWR